MAHVMAEDGIQQKKDEIDATAMVNPADTQQSRQVFNDLDSSNVTARLELQQNSSETEGGTSKRKETEESTTGANCAWALVAHTVSDSISSSASAPACQDTGILRMDASCEHLDDSELVTSSRISESQYATAGTHSMHTRIRGAGRDSTRLGRRRKRHSRSLHFGGY